MEKRHNVFDHVALGRDLRIEFRANAIHPPGPLPVRADASQPELGEKTRERWPLAEAISLVAVQVQDAEARFGRRLVDVSRLSSNDFGNPFTVHHSRLRVNG